MESLGAILAIISTLRSVDHWLSDFLIWETRNNFSGASLHASLTGSVATLLQEQVTQAEFSEFSETASLTRF